jgi:hypothetical protein
MIDLGHASPVSGATLLRLYYNSSILIAEVALFQQQEIRFEPLGIAKTIRRN